MVECQNSGCRAQATREFGGKMVCEDCYDKLRDYYNENDKAGFDQ